MPPKGNEARAAALAELAALLHRMRTDPALARRASRAAERRAAGRAAARQPARDRPRMARRQRAARSRWCSAASWPPRAASMPGASSARPTTGPASSRNFREVLAVAREEAALLAERSGLAPYDALMDRYEPGMTSADGRPRLRRPAAVAARADPARCASGRRASRWSQPRGPVPGGGAARAVRAGDAPARLRLRGRPARRQHAPVLRRRARGRAHDHALPRGRLPRQPDGHDPRDRPRALRAEPAARLAGPAGGAGALDGASTRARA